MDKDKCKLMDGIGGYFQLELSDRDNFLHSNGTKLNSGRNAFEYILRSLPDVRHLWIPYYTCDVVLEPLKKLQLHYSFYRIDQNFQIADEIQLNEGDYLLYTNYQGLMGQYVDSLVSCYGKQLIVDNAQAWYANTILGISSFYSPRKFFGVPDGGIAYSPYQFDTSLFEFDRSYNRCSHLLKRIDLGATEGYIDFNENRKCFHNQPIRKMSHLTETILRSIDYDKVASVRRKNYLVLENVLGQNNLIKFKLDENDVPMSYPYLTNDSSLKKKLIDERIFVATFWPNVLEWCGKSDWEYFLAQNTCFLPLDQRYGEEEMNRIIEIIKR